MSKKIGVITFHSAHNYGASLQCYALQETLKKKGYNTRIINYRNNKIDKNFRIISFNKTSLKQFIRSILVNIVLLNKNIKRNRAFEGFIKNQLNLSPKYKTEDELKKNFPDYDVYITGSDQVWSYDLLGELEDSYTLNFGNNKTRRISYAASVGNPENILKHKEEFYKKLKGIDFISVREEETKKELDKIMNKNIAVTLDPALLLDKNEWEEKIKNKEKEKEKYIFVYAIGEHPENLKVANYLSEITGLKIIHVEKKNKYKNILKNAYESGPFDFVNYIKNAEYVITTSFHATVFSIIFNKKLWAVPPLDTGCRITNLLKKMNMSNRIIYTIEEFKNKKFDEEIDYASINKILEEERKKSIDWLISSIEVK